MKLKEHKILQIITATIILLSFTSSLTGCQNNKTASKPQTVIKYDHSPAKQAQTIDKENKDTEKEILSLDKKIAQAKKDLQKYTKSTASTSVSTQKLASLNYNGQNIITVNNNNPSFSQADLSTSKGAWQKYGDLDNLNRASTANALLNQSLMPTTKREALKVNPTGWHNKRINGFWLYNRSHLIGYQLTGQNNNWKNLITGTRQLNDPDMVRYENQVADYLKASSKNYIRYRVTPIFRNNELLARSVEMEAQSINSNVVHFNIYIFNVQPGVNINYSDGTSKVA